MTNGIGRGRGRAREGATLGAARRQSILSLLTKGEVIAVGDLAERFRASPETIRRDIRSLEQDGLLRRVHGGVQPAGAIDLTARRPIGERLDIDTAAKRKAAEAALGLFSENMTVFLDGGSTLQFLAEAIARSGLTLSVTTNMLTIASVLAPAPNCTVTLLGGVINGRNLSTGGPEVLRSLQDRLFDLSVLGGSALNFRHGFLGPSRAHVEFAHVLEERSSAVAFVMDRGKIGRTDAHVILPFSKVKAFATDGELDTDHKDFLDDKGIEVVKPISIDQESHDYHHRTRHLS
ncbi:DeoR family transcriptional regulator [Rhizobium sp. ERR 1071]|uniref:DeoR/GlpR family DNA-binding transcription regulator n=1 Tax=Rhizobium sp. ERR 1071 TaxID=2572677 RepID=UPI00119917A2|nr:DeoR/GlpR family DNA-binding transcription regulator [Rhizobium sp. ERR1071]TWB08248.1 DeoR family transcriptional regulator [Rhizobium sp. ERR1071]